MLSISETQAGVHVQCQFKKASNPRSRCARQLVNPKAALSCQPVWGGPSRSPSPSMVQGRQAVRANAASGAASAAGVPTTASSFF